jgi:hypothetical protein
LAAAGLSSFGLPGSGCRSACTPTASPMSLAFSAVGFLSVLSVLSLFGVSFSRSRSRLDGASAGRPSPSPVGTSEPAVVVGSRR